MYVRGRGGGRIERFSVTGWAIRGHIDPVLPNSAYPSPLRANVSPPADGHQLLLLYRCCTHRPDGYTVVPDDHHAVGAGIKITTDAHPAVVEDLGFGVHISGTGASTILERRRRRRGCKVKSRACSGWWTASMEGGCTLHSNHRWMH